MTHTKSAPGDLRFNPTTNTLSVPLWYPRAQDPDRGADHPVAVEISLICVRAARAITVTYDFERNGYVIHAQTTQLSWPRLEAGEDDPAPVEVAFIPGDLGDGK